MPARHLRLEVGRLARTQSLTPAPLPRRGVQMMICLLPLPVSAAPVPAVSVGLVPLHQRTTATSPVPVLAHRQQLAQWRAQLPFGSLLALQMIPARSAQATPPTRATERSPLPCGLLLL